MASSTKLGRHVSGLPARWTNCKKMRRSWNCCDGGIGSLTWRSNDTARGVKSTRLARTPEVTPSPQLSVKAQLPDLGELQTTGAARFRYEPSQAMRRAAPAVHGSTFDQ